MALGSLDLNDKINYRIKHEGGHMDEQEQTEQDLTDVYELLEDMTPPEVRLARQLLLQMRGLRDVAEEHEERLLWLEDAIKGKGIQRIALLEGALKEVILRVEELRGGAKPAPKKRSKSVRGIYCRNCAKELEGRQRVFCTKRCAAVWHGQHQGQFATPRFEINEKPEAVVEAGVGVTKGSVDGNGKALVADGAFG